MVLGKEEADFSKEEGRPERAGRHKGGGGGRGGGRVSRWAIFQ